MLPNNGKRIENRRSRPILKGKDLEQKTTECCWSKNNDVKHVYAHGRPAWPDASQGNTFADLLLRACNPLAKMHKTLSIIVYTFSYFDK